MRRRNFSGLLATVPAFAVTPMRLAAQSKRLPLIGTLNIVGPITSLIDAYLQGLAESGYIEGRTVRLEHRSAEGRPELLPEMAAELVARKVDVICSGSGAASARAARSATSTIPIISTFTTD